MSTKSRVTPRATVPTVPTMFWLASRGQWAVKFNGKRVQLGPDKLRATAKYHALLRQHLGGASEANPRTNPLDALAARGRDLTVLDVLLGYRESLRESMSKSHVWRIDRAVELTVAECGDALARDFGPRLLLAARGRMLAAGYCRRTINQMVACVVTAWGWAVVRELVDRGSAHALREVPGLAHGEARDTDPILPVSSEDVEATLPHLGPVVRAMVEVHRLTGMRPAEVCCMSAARISTSSRERLCVGPNHTLAAVAAGDVTVWLYCPLHHKGAHRGLPRVVPLGPRVQAVLAPFLERRRAHATLFSPRENVVLSGLGRILDGKYKSREPGELYAVSTYGHAVKAACVRAGVAPWTPNQLRHALATRLANEAGMETARTALGHTSQQMTLHYVAAILSQAATWAGANG